MIAMFMTAHGRPACRVTISDDDELSNPSNSEHTLIGTFIMKMQQHLGRPRLCCSDVMMLLLMLLLPFSSVAFLSTTKHPWHPYSPCPSPPYSSISFSTVSKKTRWLQTSSFRNRLSLSSKKEKDLTILSNYSNGAGDNRTDNNNNQNYNATRNELNGEYDSLVNLSAISTPNLGGSTRMGSPLKGLSFGLYGTSFPSFSMDYRKNSTKLAIPKRTYQYMKPNLGSSFPSFSMDYWKNSTKRAPNQQNAFYSTQTSRDGNLTLPPSLQSNIQANDTLTLHDLQEILKYNGYIRQDDLNAIQQNTVVSTNRQFSRNNGGKSAVVQTYNTPGSGVALPQLSLLSYKSLQRGTSVASAVYGLILSSTILPNLWLMGVFFGGLYGYEITNLKDPKMPQGPKNAVSKVCIASGRKLAKTSLQLYDSWQALWFLYKTGQLSYEYYKRFEVMDERFGIQNKMDAWNSRFRERKVKFDQWEKENEIGRTVLAGLRTVWLVDEKAKLRAKQKSRYRVIQWVYSVKHYFQRQWKRLSLSLRRNNSKFWNEFLTGVRYDMKNSGTDALGTRIGAIVASLVAINITGALFAISAPLLTLMAALMGIVWPSWVPELVERLKLLTEETRARGRGDENYSPASFNSMNTAKLLGRYDKSKYHYYKRPDGSKQYYRTGQSYFRFQNSDKTEQKALPWPWNQKSKEQKHPLDPWGLFGNARKGKNQ